MSEDTNIVEALNSIMSSAKDKLPTNTVDMYNKVVQLLPTNDTKSGKPRHL